MVEFLEHVSLEKAWSLILERVSPVSRGEWVDILSSGPVLRRVLAEDIVSLENLPHYPASAVDGYALRSADTSRASSTNPRVFSEGHYLWANTGSMVGRPFDSVVMVEDTSLEGDTLKVARPLAQGENIRPEGEDVARGQVVARKGDPLSSFNIPLLIASGNPRVLVLSLPRSIFIPTGDEIIPALKWVEEKIRTGDQVPETNSHMLKGIFSEWGYPLDIHDLLPDDGKLIKEALERAICSYDLVMIGAGTAKGKRDHSAEVIRSVADPIFRGVRMKPGRPVIAGISGNIPVVALPGFPMSALVAAWTVVFPMLSRLCGEKDATDLSKAIGGCKKIETRLLKHYSSQQGVCEWLRLKCGEIDGTRFSWPLSSGASSMFSIADADGFALVDDSTLEIPKGSSLQVWMKRNLDWEKRLVYQGSNDPAIDRLVSFVRDHGGDLAIRSVGSLGGLAAISRGEGHMASCHLLDPETGTYNDSYIMKFPDSSDWRRIKLFKREQGFLVQKGNPRGIRSAKDLSKGGVFFINRQPGAGTRVLFDHLLKEAGIEPAAINGYNNVAVTHLEASARISNGSADATLGIRAAAEAFGNDFVPVTEEQFEIVIPGRFHSHPGVALFLEALVDKKWRSVVQGLGGYTWTN
ncbi:MAG: substrate-binding domain-containing protein [Thermovirgaceae bacterium]|nr:substrate-binding domain-containing protein [Thermovirgaceae bacterium]